MSVQSSESRSRRGGRTVDVVGNDPVSLETSVELVAHAVDDDRVETDAVEEVEREGERLHVVGQDGAANLDDGEVSRGGEDLEVAANFAAGSERVEEANDGLLRSIESAERGRCQER